MLLLGARGEGVPASGSENGFSAAFDFVRYDRRCDLLEDDALVCRTAKASCRETARLRKERLVIGHSDYFLLQRAISFDGLGSDWRKDGIRRLFEASDMEELFLGGETWLCS